MEKEINFIDNRFDSKDETNPIIEFSLKSVQKDTQVSQSLDEKITNIFIVMGIPAHIKGYHYLREAVKLAKGNYDLLNSITKKLYPLIAKRFNTTSCNVARGIYNAIEVAWNKGKIVNLNTIFGLGIYEHGDKPSNRELIALLAEKIYFDSMLG